MKINIFQNGEDKGAVVRVLQTISYSDEAVIEYSRNSGFQITAENVTEAVYLLISVIFLCILFISLYKIKRLKKKYPETKIEDVSFISTDARGTPFSFFKSIFWNNAIDLHSRSGQQIFNHEIAHIKEKHSYDKIFMNIVLVFFWINPFFWLMRKELNMIHEFVADKEALEDNDINAFAEMVLQTVYPGQNFSLTNNFFYSPIKRRIIMLAKNKNPRVSYVSRLLVLPLAAIVFFAFTLKVKNRVSNLYDGKTITVVIDAGHGGADNGAVSADGVKEKDITLAIAKKIAELNSNPHIKIVLSRDNDQTIPVKDRVVFAKNNNADIFISIHVNAAANKQLSGFSVLTIRKTTDQNVLLSSAIIDELKKSYKTEDKIGIRNRGILVIDSSACPAAIIECGFLSNSNDAAFISNSANQEKIAENVLDAIEKYASSINTFKGESPIVTDSIPTGKQDSIPFAIFYKNKKIDSINGMRDTSKVRLTFTDGSHLIITNKEALKNGLRLPLPPPVSIPKNALYVIDGKISTNPQLKELDPKNIKSITILKGDSAIKKYGEKGKNGVIEIFTKNKYDGVSMSADTGYIHNSSSNPISDNSTDKSKVIVIHSKIPYDGLIFVDGKEVSQDKMKNIPPYNIQSINVLKGDSAEKKYGAKGKNGVIEITTKKTEKEINHTQTYLPESQKDSIPRIVFMKVENEASFPGGPTAWQKYIVKKIQASLDSFTEADYGTCLVKFIVNTDGSVSNVEATTMKGTHLAKTSVNAIKNGPKWIPASQNGHTVASYRLQPVTLTNPDEKKSSAESEQPVNFTSLTIVKVNKNILLKLLQPASFPGGQSAWLKYISRVFDKNGSELMADKNNFGTCKVSFIVSKDGKVSDVIATTMKGTQLAEIALNTIKKGPYWIPAKEDGQSVNSYVIQPVTFALNDKITIKGEPE